MKYRIFNQALMEKYDFPIEKSKKFYKYLLDNNVAYYYARYVSNTKNNIEEDIIKAGDTLLVKFTKTITLINSICKNANIEFLLFKTYKHIPEIVDGDIDLLIKEKDFSLFLTLLQEYGFTIIPEGPTKASCLKEGFCKIEPRTSFSFHGTEILKKQTVWKHIQTVKIDSLTIKTTTKEIDTLFTLLNALYGPNYIKLYSYLVFKNTNPENLLNLLEEKEIKNDLRIFLKALNSSQALDTRFPLFAGNITFIIWWIKKIAINANISLLNKCKHLLFFFYAKYGYIIFNTLPFRHDWNTKYV